MKLRLLHKLLLALFASTAMVLVLIILLTRMGIGRGFEDFLQQQEQSRVEALVPSLITWYESNGSWDALARDPRRFHRMIDTILPASPENTRPPRRPPARGPTPSQRARGPAPSQRARGPAPLRRPGPGGQRSGEEPLPRRVFLLEANFSPLIGHMPPDADRDGLLPIEVSGTVVGWLGLVSNRGLNTPEEADFIRRQRNGLLASFGIGIVLAAILAWLMARHLSRPVSAVAGGIKSLAKGEYQTRVTTHGDDEIAGLGKDVNTLATALTEHESARRRWTADIAHELRTPLAIISGELEAMADGVRPMNEEQLASVREEVGHLNILVADLHSLALTDSGALAYKMQAVDLNELVESEVGVFKKQALQKNLELGFKATTSTSIISGDEQRLRQLLRNLLENAIRYTDAGGGISITLERVKALVTLEINDTTPGVSADECERLFERLYRPEVSRNRNSGGSGLGLAICKNIATAHGGIITARPGRLGGLQIIVTLPV